MEKAERGTAVCTTNCRKARREPASPREQEIRKTEAISFTIYVLMGRQPSSLVLGTRPF